MLPNARIDFIQAIVDLARELPPEAVSALAIELESNPSVTNWVDLVRLAGTRVTKEKLRGLESLSNAVPNIDGRAISLAFQVAALATRTVEAEQRMEIAWTGPRTQSFPVRRVDQILYDLIESAANEVLLVTFAAYKTQRAMSALVEASERGVRVRLVLELAIESGGKVSFDGLKAFRSYLPRADIYYWPLDRRPQGRSGSYGSMHAKCLISDRKRALVSSANLTNYALEANMELGLVVEGVLAARLAAHFDQLIAQGDLSLSPSE